ncbi:MAG: suppressor of fused domain protein [Phycisphaerae bacterium]
MAIDPPPEHAAWFERVWAQREAQIYPDLFGPLAPEIHTIPAELFAKLGCRNVAPAWLCHGVLISPPNERHNHWVYLTSALSNPWGQTASTARPPAYSGLGFEFIFYTPTAAAWAIQVLHWVMAIQLMVASEQMRGTLLEVNDRIPLGTALDGKQSLLRHLWVNPLPHGPQQFTLESGVVDLLLLVGLTHGEMDFLRGSGPEATREMLTRRGHYPQTDATRTAAV